MYCQLLKYGMKYLVDEMWQNKLNGHFTYQKLVLAASSCIFGTLKKSLPLVANNLTCISSALLSYGDLFVFHHDCEGKARSLKVSFSCCSPFFHSLPSKEAAYRILSHILRRTVVRYIYSHITGCSVKNGN